MFNGNDITSYISNNAIRGSLAGSMGKTFRLPGLNVGSTFNLGANTLEATINLSDGSSVSDNVTWDVLENTEP